MEERLQKNQHTANATVPLSQNNMDTPVHQSLYAQGYEMRKKVVGEDYVARALEKGSSDFMRPLQQFATVCTPLCFSSSIPYTHATFGARNARLMRETNHI
jgi:hypothetical protein